MKFLDIYRADKPLYALQHSGRVILHVNGGVSMIKKRYPTPLLILQTTESLGVGEGGLLATLVGYGSAMLDTSNFKRTPLIMMGMTAVAAGLLINELITLYKQR